MLKKINLKNKTALVTGAGKGLGKACAIALAEAGAIVILLSRTKSDLVKVSNIIKKTKGSSKFFVCDVTNLDNLKKVLRKISRLDILINNAGITLDNLSLRMKTEEWQKVIDINLSSTFYMCKYGIKKMLKLAI